MTSSELAEVLEIAAEAARAGGACAIAARREGFGVHHKGVVDLVTDADLKAEEAILEVLARRHDAPVLAEESGGEAKPGLLWVVDPIDGTTNFAHGVPHFCASVALVKDGQPLAGVVYNPASDECFAGAVGVGSTLNGEAVAPSGCDALRQALCATGFAYHHRTGGVNLPQIQAILAHAQGIRRMGSAALDLVYVACGRYDVYWEHGLKPWDVAGGAAIVLGAGGVLSDLHGGDFSIWDGDVLVAANAPLQTEVIRAFDAIN